MRNTPLRWEVWPGQDTHEVRTQLSRGELHRNRSLIWTKRGTCCVIGFFSTTLNCDIRACRSFQPWENSALNRQTIHRNSKPKKMLEVRRVVPPTCFLYFPRGFERQELLELTSNNSVLDFCSCECVHAFSAEHS